MNAFVTSDMTKVAGRVQLLLHYSQPLQETPLPVRLRRVDVMGGLLQLPSRLPIAAEPDQTMGALLMHPAIARRPRLPRQLDVGDP